MINRTLSTIALASGLLFGLVLATRAGETDGAEIKLANMNRIAPEITGITHWLNSPPLKLSDLRGKVVLVDFWTFGCINCVNTLPQITKLHEKYKDKGLIIIGVHSPEFPFEKSTTNVATAIKRHGIAYPVAQDNDFSTWNAYHNRYWPAQYIVDKNGKIVFEHAGEGAYGEIEQTIQTLLMETMANDQPTPIPNLNRISTQLN